MSATTLRVIGFLFLAAAAVVAVLNLKRVANLGMFWLSPPLLIVGVGLITASRRKAQFLYHPNLTSYKAAACWRLSCARWQGIS